MLDTLFLAVPIAFKGRLIQYVGRVLRPYTGKTTAEVHDYHDTRTGVLAASLAKRAPGYTSLGFPTHANSSDRSEHGEYRFPAGSTTAFPTRRFSGAQT